MTFRVDAPWIAGAFLVGNQGGGVLAENLAPSGYLFGGPADIGKEICGRITYWPPGLNLVVGEDGSTTTSGVDGVYIAQYQRYVNYVPSGAVMPLVFTIGSVPGALACAWIESSETSAVVLEIETFYARAPDGDGYRPRRNPHTIRPDDIQG